MGNLRAVVFLVADCHPCSVRNAQSTGHCGDARTAKKDGAGTSWLVYNVPVGTNERLRTAMLKAGLTVVDLAGAAGVDPKTCERWVTKGRTPHRLNARKAAVALQEDLSYLWPALERGVRQRGMHPELVAVYAARADTPLDAW